MGRALIAIVLAGCWRGGSPAGSPHDGGAPAPASLRAAIERAREHASELIDPTTGLVFLDRFLEPGEPPGDTSERHLCGDALARFLRDDWKREVGDALALALENGSLACRQAELACRFGGRGEYDPVYHVRFSRTGGRLVLYAIAYDDEVLVGSDEVRAEHARQTALIAKLEGPCLKN